jgi:hypothetical protein
MSLFAEFVSG